MIVVFNAVLELILNWVWLCFLAYRIAFGVLELQKKGFWVLGEMGLYFALFKVMYLG